MDNNEYMVRHQKAAGRFIDINTIALHQCTVCPFETVWADAKRGHEARQDWTGDDRNHKLVPVDLTPSVDADYEPEERERLEHEAEMRSEQGMEDAFGGWTD